MVSVMRVDVAPRKHLIVLGVISALILIVAIIVGATAPDEFSSVTYYAYGCPGNSHDWNNNNCTGVQLSNNQSSWSAYVPAVTALNRFWSLEFMAYTLQSGQVNRDLQMQIEIFGKDDPSEGVVPSLLYFRNATETADCNDGECEALILISEQNLQYTYYFVKLRVLNGGQLSGDTAPFLGDVKLTLWQGSAGYSSLELALRIIYLFGASTILIAFLWTLRRVPMDEWAWEQRALVILLLSLLALNNPFFGLQYVARGWFFHFLDAFLAILYLSTFLLFGLLIVDKIRLEEVRMELGKQHIPKFIAVGIFAVLGIIMFSWVDIRDDSDPILAHRNILSSIEVLFYIDATIFAGVLCWLAILVIMTIPVATAKPYLMTRFLFASIPTSFCVISILIGIFNGTFGPLNDSTLSMVFFLTLYNEYIWILTYGFWPVHERFGARNPSEADSIIRFEDNNF